MVTRTGKPALPDDPDLKSELLLWQDSSGPRAVLAENGQPVEQLGTAEPDQPAVGDIWLGVWPGRSLSGSWTDRRSAAAN